ncbi:MAG: septum site-determining protein MinC [Butyrivibrio sp.]|nr:septum site-determining protein MinC [Lachnospiraceae bacterium]MBQ8032146.1 septum site-determining protein MinC [Butyrivibrio sp.]MBR1669975.1 septum site-determining protein MinC [Butyrivibrio sp.]
MNKAVTIKGTKSGIILVLDPTLSFDLLKDQVADKFREASSFLGKSRQGLIIRGARLSEDEIDEIIHIIEDNSELKVMCVIDDESEIEAFFNEKLNPSPPPAPENAPQEEDSGSEDKAVIIRGNLRSGQEFESKKSIVVLGDIKPGATLKSDGSIFVLGELRGNAFAGAGGDESAIIMAIRLDPIQLGIADQTAISPNAERGSRIKVRKKSFFAKNDDEPEVAYIEKGSIVKTPYGASFLRQILKI